MDLNTREIPREYAEVKLVLDSLFDEVDGQSFYEYIFPDNEEEGEILDNYSKPNAIYFYSDSYCDLEVGPKLKRRIMLKDTWKDDFYDYVEGNKMTLCGGLVYRGKSNKLENAQRMNALIFDLDGVGDSEIRNLLLRFGQPAERLRTLPMPTFIVMSGTGIHIYYVFQDPIDLYPNIKLQLKSLKYDLTFRIWEYKSTSSCQQIQYQSINQSFRMVGSINEKYVVPIVAYKTGERVTLDYLNKYARFEENKVDMNRPFRPSKITRFEAKESYPEWYERVVIKKKKQPKKWDISGKVHGNDPFALYNWWLKKVVEVKGGHRYFYMMCLVIYACKCDVPRKKLEEDLQIVFNELRTYEHTNPLTQEDIKSALEIYSKEYYNFTIADIEKLTGIYINRNKRNGRTRAQHLGRARAVLNFDDPEGNWRNKNGRPKGSGTLQKKVQEWRKQNPSGRKIDCERETHISRHTILKWWNK